MKDFVLECCVDTLEAALAAEQGGATRLELCGNLVIGGTTPSPFLLEEIRQRSAIPIHVMIRPRFGDFLYTDSELRIMEREIRSFRELGAQGVVFGVLTADGRLDVDPMARLMEAAGEMRVTLHRAFDLTRDPLEALEAAKRLGVRTILTSGQRQTAWEGRDTIAALGERCGGVEMMAGASVEAGNIAALRAATGIDAYHLSGKVMADSPMTYRKEGVSMGLPAMSEYERWQCSAEKVAAARRILEQID